jgi:hypothetical protein
MKHSLGLAILFALGVVACGGSGSDNDNPPLVPTDEIGITVSNGQEVARVTYLAAAQSGDSAGLVGNAGIAADSGGILKTSAGFAKPVQIAVNMIPFGPETVPCDMNGTMTISGNIQNPMTLSAGDTISIEARECDDGQGEIIDGDIHFTVAAFSGDMGGDLYELTMALEIIDFQVRTPDEVVLSNGDVTVTVDTLRSPVVSTMVTGDSLTLDLSGASETLVGFSTSETLDGGLVPSPYTMTASGTLDSTQLGGTVHYSTPVMFEGLDLDYPHTGELLIQGENNTSVRLIALEGGRVRILIDSDGDGEPNDTIETTWDELQG